eukprot:3285651-Prorocentrum_lima.AAC.1
MIAQQIKEAEEAARRQAEEKRQGGGGRGARSASPGRGQPSQQGGPRPLSTRGGGVRNQTQVEMGSPGAMVCLLYTSPSPRDSTSS